MRPKHFIAAVLMILFLDISTGAPDTPEPLKPGTSTGQLTVNNQTFNIKHAYVKKTKDEKDGAGFLVLLTNRPFPQDLSTLNRFDLNKYATRYDLQGVALGMDQNHSILYVDILRFTSITKSAEFQRLTNESDLIEGRIYTGGEKRYFNNKFEFDITFSVKP